jgi:hypothetical protein
VKTVIAHKLVLMEMVRTKWILIEVLDHSSRRCNVQEYEHDIQTTPATIIRTKFHIAKLGSDMLCSPFRGIALA